MKYQLAATNRLGNRAINQDRFGSTEREGTVLLTLCDGMGGYKGGELAAEIAVLKMMEHFHMTQLPITDPESFFREAVRHAHSAIYHSGNSQNPPITPRTTLVSCLIHDDGMWTAHLGDSRIYLLRNNLVAWRSRDHSIVQELLDAGKLHPKQAASHPNLNQVTRCVGGDRDIPVPEVSERISLAPKDVVLLCSDGLWGQMEDPSLANMVSREDLDDTLNILAQQAETHAYPHSDNVTVMAMRWLSAEADPDHQIRSDLLPEHLQVIEAIDEIDEALRKVDEDLKNLTG